MRRYYHLLLAILLLIFTSSLSAQTFDGEWSCLYSTIDDQPNSTGYNTISVGVVSENNFVALVRRGTNTTSYLVGYNNADSTNGRQGFVTYAQAGRQTRWDNFFDFVLMEEAYDLATKDNFVYVANNDPEHNILVFEWKEDSVYTAPLRLSTGQDLPIWGIDVDDNGRVYVTQGGDSTSAGKVLVYDSPANNASWEGDHVGTPFQTIELPENGELRGVAVNSDGTLLYVSNYITREIYLYTWDENSGYTRSETFSFQLNEEFTTANATYYPGPWGMKFLNSKNLLFAAADVDFFTGDGYQYGKMLIIHPTTGAIMDSINAAQWNLDITGAYDNRPNQIGIASGYTSTYNVDFDESNNVYSQSYFGWTVEKWKYSTELPFVDIGVSVEQTNLQVPDNFNLAQNYPNPFNPTTTISFDLNKEETVKLAVYNIAGELVQLILSDNLEAGSYKLNFDASNLSSGTYIYSLTAGNQKITKKMMLIK